MLELLSSILRGTTPSVDYTLLWHYISLAVQFTNITYVSKHFKLKYINFIFACNFAFIRHIQLSNSTGYF